MVGNVVYSSSSDVIIVVVWSSVVEDDLGKICEIVAEMINGHKDLEAKDLVKIKTVDITDTNDLTVVIRTIKRDDNNGKVVKHPCRMVRFINN